QAELEVLADEILTDKQRILSLSKRQNQVREALALLRDDAKLDNQAQKKTEKNMWYFQNGMFTLTTIEKSALLLNEGTPLALYSSCSSRMINIGLVLEQEYLENEIKSVRKRMKERTIELEQKSGNAERVKGFDLQAIN
ncbi:hypothetical protein HK098_008008, partial [Nowakowskiella sp. JEL0407]